MIVYITGEIGCATKMKLTTNLLMCSVLAGLAESLALAEKMGLDHDDVMQILDMSPISCSFIRQKGAGNDRIHAIQSIWALQYFMQVKRIGCGMNWRFYGCTDTHIPHQTFCVRF